MNRFSRLFDIERLPNYITKIVIICLILYILFNTYSFFGLPDIKNLLKNSGEKMSESIASETLINYHPIVGYVINDEYKEEDKQLKWQDKVISFATSLTPIYKFIDTQYSLSLDKSDPSFTNNLVAFDGSKNDNSQDNDNDQDDNSQEVGSNVTIPMPQITGTQYSIEQLSNFNFLLSNFYIVTDATVVYPTDLDASKLMNKDLKMVQDNSKPQILIYHTHSQEAFTDSVPGNPDTTIVGVGTYLAEILSKQFGYNVIHDTSTYDLVNGVLDRHKAYDYADQAVSQILADNPSIEVVLDIHRDGVGETTHLVTQVNGKPTAKIMFFNGISRLKDVGDIDYLFNPNLQDNLAMSMQMKMLATAYYPEFTRKNYINAYQYNLDLRPKSMLIEVGAQTNTLQEEKNAMEPLAVLLNKLLQ